MPILRIPLLFVDRIRMNSLLPIVTSVLLILTMGCDGPELGNENVGTSDASHAGTGDHSEEMSEELVAQIRTFCGDCHVMPDPASFPKYNWQEEVRRGFDFYVQSGRDDLKPPAVSDVYRFFREQAPEKLQYTISESTPSPIHFTEQPLGPSVDGGPSTSYVETVSDSENGLQIKFSDMKGTMSLLSVGGDTVWSSKVAANPVVFTACQLDSDDGLELICCDLGSFQPEDHNKGKLILLPNGTDGDETAAVILMDEVGRVSDVVVEDFDGDEKPDIMVAEFGWHKTGGIHLLRNVSTDQELRFEREVLDDRPGTIHLLRHDLNADGRQDVVALVSQEHEQVIALMNEKSGFRSQLLYQAPDPAWGSSGISFVDLDGDGDQDLLCTNGDSFDSYLVKPYHGISWLENQGGLKFEHHHIAFMPGVHRVLPADLDGDGDLDLVASALLPQKTIDAEKRAFEGVIWLERTAADTYERHVLSQGHPVSPAMTLADIDADGDVDVIAGNFHDGAGAPLTVYRNDGPVDRQ